MKTTILVVDDEVDLKPLLMSRFRRQITDERYHFLFAHSSRDALAILQHEPDIDLLLLDIDMPDMDGLTLLGQLPGTNPMLQTVILSAHDDRDNMRTAMNRGAFDFISKPIDFADLGSTIEKTVDHVRQLRESQQGKVINELKTRFFDNITHEFRTPLTLILAPVQQLLKRHSEPAELRQSLQLIERNARQLLQLINQLLDLAKLEAGHLSVAYQTGDLGYFVGQIVQAFGPVAEAKNLTISYQNDLTEFVAFDAGKIEQIVHNLLTNALKFTQTGGVSVKLTGQSVVRLTITDTGIGIIPEKLPYIFNRFYQVPPNGNEVTSALIQNPGTGIGLALIKELAELMEGSIKVSSVSIRTGQPSGTTFAVELPLLQASDYAGTNGFSKPSLPVSLTPTQAEKSAQISESDEAEKALVLVVEDNEELNAFLANELSDTYRILTAPNGREGWQLAQTELPDLVLTDVMMPDMDGYELTYRLKTDPATNHIAVVMLTAKNAQPNRIEGLQQGADDYVAKPFQVEELRLRLHNLLVRQQMLRNYFYDQFSRPETPAQPETLTDKFIHNLYAILEDHLDDSAFRVDELAREVGMSRRTLHRKLTAVANLTITDFIRQYRLKRGGEMLREGHNVSETAYQVGYESPAHFSTVFKEFFGQTPSEYTGG